MTGKAAGLAYGLAGLLAPAAFGFSSDNSSLARSFNKTMALTNSPILVTAAFTNGGTNALRGFFYSEQLPSGLAVSTVSVTLNGQGITNFVLECGQDGDVYAGCTPWRWRLETATNFTEAHPVPAQGAVQISYTISSPTQGSFFCQQFAWVGWWPAGTNASFGCSESANQQTVSFLTTTNRPTLSAQYGTNGCLIRLQGDPGASYVLDASSDLLTWVPLTTNVSSFSFTDTNTAGLATRFYRGRSIVGGQ
jgi:uncharacterized repeat protein (TIGR01451 family)